ncbi:MULTISPECIES: hypothetical protein [unclassified Streptomyces]|uniref:hypothetical protein n=1 Tax=unclassified Streptomyces TaxID=2593676 RepID=UPI0033B77FF7
MSVFARLLRRSKATEEASTAEVQADTLTPEPAADAAEEVKESSRTETETEAEVEAEVEATAEETVEAATTEDVEIPQQQTAEKAADNEAGESARK